MNIQIENVDLNGVTLQGSIQATLSELTAAFGTPQRRRIHDITAHPISYFWALRLNDQLSVTIYDWNEAFIPGASDIIAWRIGGTDKAAVALLHRAFREELGLGQSRSRAA